MEEKATYEVENTQQAEIQTVDKAASTTQDSKDIYHTLVITEEIGSEPKVFNGDIMFNIVIDKEKDDVGAIEGVLVTEIFFDTTEIYQLDSWRFCLNHVSVKEIQCDTTSDYVKYIFTAKTFAAKA